MEINDLFRIEEIEEFEALMEANMEPYDALGASPQILLEELEGSSPQITFKRKGNVLKISINDKEVAELIYSKSKEGKEEHLKLVEKGKIPGLYRDTFAVFHINYNSLPIELLKLEMIEELSELLMVAISQFGTKNLKELYLEDFEKLINSWLSLPGIYDRVQKVFSFAEERDIYGTLLGFVVNEIVKGYFQDSLLEL